MGMASASFPTNPHFTANAHLTLDQYAQMIEVRSVLFVKEFVVFCHLALIVILMLCAVLTSRPYDPSFKPTAFRLPCPTIHGNGTTWC
jgi:hypothetical protein